MTTEADALILRYLQDLESQLGDLPGNRRQELLDEVSAHIAAARADLAPETEAGVRTMLERLGDPADIAAEARDRAGVEAGPARPATPWLEIATVVLLVLPFLGWVLVSARRSGRAARRRRRDHRPQPARAHPGRGAVRAAGGRRRPSRGPAAGPHGRRSRDPPP
jgi:hypothetical protein